MWDLAWLHAGRVHLHADVTGFHGVQDRMRLNVVKVATRSADLSATAGSLSLKNTPPRMAYLP